MKTMVRVQFACLLLAAFLQPVTPLSKLTADQEVALVHNAGPKKQAPATTTGVATTATSELQYYEALVAGAKDKIRQTQNTCVSLMLLVAVGFMMANFYLVNSEDEDIKLVSWQVISSTISIFSSVLIFQAIQGCVDTYILAGVSQGTVILAGFVHFAIWIVILQLSLAYSSGSMFGREEFEEMEKLEHEMKHELEKVKHEPPEVQHHLEEHFKEEIEEWKLKVELDVKTWAILLGHIAGFAAINAFGNIQQAMPHNPLASLLSVVFTLLGLIVVFKITDYIRETIAAGDGVKDESEELWDDEVEETENDVLALAVSWLFVQVVREMIVGDLPDVEGIDADDANITNWCCAALFGFGILAALFSLIKSRFFKGDEHSRTSLWIRDGLSMTMAWSVLFGVNWFLKPRMAVEEDSSLLTTTNAMITTAFAICSIFVLDYLADLPEEITDADVDRALRAFISAFGILIGFAWERSFDSAVGGLADDGVLPFSPAITKLLLALLLGALVIPAWKWHILRNAMEVKEEGEEQKHKGAEHGKEQHDQEKGNAHGEKPPHHESLAKKKEGTHAAQPADAVSTAAIKSIQLSYKTQEDGWKKTEQELRERIKQLEAKIQ